MILCRDMIDVGVGGGWAVGGCPRLEGHQEAGREGGAVQVKSM